jgi:hypothetical protein
MQPKSAMMTLIYEWKTARIIEKPFYTDMLIDKAEKDKNDVEYKYGTL